MRYFFHIGYSGLKYGGWQRQPKVDSVQERIEGRLSEILKKPTKIYGCGRTDSMVHASQYFFHIDVETSWDFDLKFRLNKRLPDDIAIFDIFPVEDTWHARYDATDRTYDYFIHTYKDPFLNNISSLYYESSLNLINMAKAVAMLPRYTNYRSFCKSPDQYNHTHCDIKQAQLLANRNGDRIRFQITSNRFLYRMIRILVGKLLQIGKGELTLDDFEHYLAYQTIPLDIKPAYPQGLFLSKIVYPYLDIPARPEFSAFQQNSLPETWQTIL